MPRADHLHLAEAVPAVSRIQSQITIRPVKPFDARLLNSGELRELLRRVGLDRTAAIVGAAEAAPPEGRKILSFPNKGAGR